MVLWWVFSRWVCTFPGLIQRYFQFRNYYSIISLFTIIFTGGSLWSFNQCDTFVLDRIRRHIYTITGSKFGLRPQTCQCCWMCVRYERNLSYRFTLCDCCHRSCFVEFTIIDFVLKYLTELTSIWLRLQIGTACHLPAVVSVVHDIWFSTGDYCRYDR